MGHPLRLLLVEDSSDDAQLLVRQLASAGYDVRHERVDSQDALRAALARGPWDLVISDHSMPGFSGTAALQLVRELGGDVPFIFVSGTIGEDLAVSAMKAGASDYVLKDKLKRLVPAIERELREAEARHSRRRAEDELRQSEDRFSRIFRSSPAGIAITTADEGRFVDANDAFCALTGYDRGEVIGRTAAELGFAQDLAEQADLLDELRETGTAQNVDLELRTKRGDRRLVLASFERIELGGRRCLLSLMHDISERKRLEDQLRQAQKMEAVGRLAGGVAHDFNNLLSVIIGYCDLLFRSLAPDAPERDEIREIRDAADAASALTSQLLAFSRRQVVERRPLDLNGVVTRAERLLRRLVGEHIEIVVRLAPDLAAVEADAGQLEQVLMNLVVNARDAMPAGGTIIITTVEAMLGDAFVRDHSGARAGRYVELRVADTGIGMDAETQAHIFEPFFTTKEVGRGTGLGLATVYGIVKQSEGFIWVESARAQGTTFRMYFPPSEAPGRAAPEPRAVPASLTGTETILVVEDSQQLRELIREVLEVRGYRVLDAEHGDQALEVASRHQGPIHLLLTDVIMPGMNGRQLADRLVALRPEAKVLFVSGYTADALVRYGVEGGAAYVQKPFTPDALARAVRDVLG